MSVITKLTVLTALAGTAILLGGCADNGSSTPMVTEVVTVTAGAEDSGTGDSGAGESPGAPGSSAAGGDQKTEVVTVVAVSRDGQPEPGWTVESGGGGALSCDPLTPSPSAVSGDIYSCAPSAAAAHTCWPAANSRTALLCASTPWDKTLRSLTSDVPLTGVNKPADPRPWALELDNGVRCVIRTGGAWGGRNDGYLGAYGCADTRDVVLVKSGGEVVDTSSDRWSVKLGPLGVNNEDFPPPATVGVVRAYFAGSAS
ncbi:hypothetical protein GOHSU_16_00860 [Gordonia hirsuta DSM 44140 = NBRC 16056]|uniref:Uncharacterized protein n=1 Tax=Gordonia hirsuta DSM 44140 = NBRC 16056 TaxID=1121927 RepID=L7LAS3_9ACTN|nr:hypothetical protein [Gordonia hirsuta]GAC57128.1 hypothetical protein GOHSU_16_00860 [Gordonia hirsuta DSM 44140 = NBRC 16056]